ncbi:MAG: hypothetical protein Q9184_005069 [Pyrenodesmia sp. 2 TL-2023]
MASSTQQIQPSGLGGQGRQMDQANFYDDPTFGGLRDITFSSCCPPEVQPNTRIIAICGVTDYIGTETTESSSEDEEEEADPKGKKTLRKIVSKGKDMFSTSRRQARKNIKEKEKAKTTQQGEGAPKNDGWFFSDFYLFHHIFKGVGANQLWLTSEPPHKLVDKYTEYQHGEPADRRVVLEARMLPEIQAVNNIRVFPRGDLLQDFLRTFEGECKIAARYNQPVLLLIFGHGDKDTHGIAIGGNSSGVRAPRLQIDQIERILRGLQVSVTLLMTSCYSGGWVYQPELNVSAATATGPTNESLAWPMTLGGRAHGSFWSTAVLNAFIKFEDERLTQLHPKPTDAIKLEDVKESSTFVKLAEVIRQTLITEVDASDREHQVRFASQDDAWGMEWRQRSGIPLATFRQRWQELRQITSQPSASSDSKTGGFKSDKPGSAVEDEFQGEYGCKKGISRRQARSVVRQLCLTYLESFPGASNRSSNVSIHSHARDLIQGEQKSDWQIEELQLTLSHRMEMMKWASRYKSMMGLDFLDCHLFDFDEWQRSCVRAGKEKGKQESDKKFNLFDYCQRIVDKAKLFPDAPLIEGHGLLLSLSYTKSSDYLAVALVESGLGRDAISTAVARLIPLTEAKIKRLNMDHITFNRSVRGSARFAFSTLGKRLRSPSPRKQQRGSIPSFSEATAS